MPIGVSRIVHSAKIMSHWAQYAEIALKVVRAASLASKSIQKELLDENVIQKKDLSPVTYADYVIQATIALHLKENIHSEFKMIAEEDSMYLRSEEGSKQLDLVVKAVNSINNNKAKYTSEDILGILDDCHYSGSSKEDYWVLDPIDGTVGFINNDQYAIGLAYISGGEPVIGVMGCPNLNYHGLNKYLTKPYCYVESDRDRNRKFDSSGCVFTAIRGNGTVCYDLNSHESRSVRASQLSSGHATCPAEALTVISRHNSNRSNYVDLVLNGLNMNQLPIYMDSMCKYAVVARGDVSVYIRHHCIPNYRENVWDHAAGSIVLQEAGGIVTDIFNTPLDFSLGDKLFKNEGIVASAPGIHEHVIRQISSCVTNGDC